MSVFLKRQQVRRQKAVRKFIRRCEPALFSGLVIAGGIVVLYILYLFVCFGPALAVRAIAVAGAGTHVAPDAIAKLSGVEVGEGLFAVSLARVEQRLLAHPWITSAAVRRQPPHTIWISISEHVPAAVLAAHGKLFFVDTEGAVFKEIEGGDDKAYPVFTGMESTDATRVAHALELVRWFTLSRIAGDGELAEVHYDPATRFSLVAGRPPLLIQLGNERPGWCTDRLDRLAHAIRTHPGRIRYIVACDRERVVVKYDPVGVPPA